MLNFLRYELSVRQAAIFGWGLGLSGFIAVYTIFYPFIPGEMMGMIGEIELYQAMGITDMSTFGGYFASTVLNFLSLLAIIFALTNATATLAGEEDAGTLELLATLPLARWQIVVLKAIAMSIALLFVLVLAGLMGIIMVYVVSTLVDESIMEPMRAFTLALEAWPITFVFMMISLWLAAYLPTRRVAVAAATVVVIFSFFGNNLVPLVDGLEPIRPLFLYQYYDRSAFSITEGSMSTGDLLILLGAGAFFLGLAILSFQRRNLTTAAWPWQRARGE
jgi:ABC-2 type transport system permease protein